MPLILFRNQLIEKSIWKSKGKTHVSLSICHAEKAPICSLAPSTIMIFNLYKHAHNPNNQKQIEIYK